MIFQGKVIAKAKRNLIKRIDATHIKAYVSAAREKGKANEAVIALLGDFYSVSKRQITILRGHTTAQKLIKITGL